MTSWASSTDGSGPSAVPGMLLADRYRLTEPLASGGMAQVWSAVDTVLDRPVAAKILHAHLATDQAFIERFRREAVAAARLHHNSIVAIYDTISSRSIEAIMMELIDGRTLREVLDEAGALPGAEVIRISIEIAGALDEAHRAGIVHRDIKPANIMLATDDRVLVTDFGIAKAGSDADLTVTGTLLGTAKYLAPEQIIGDSVDPRADLYALGIVMFEALTGTVPFKANTDAATALARLHQTPPPVRQLRPNVSPGLEAIVTRLMALDPAHRYPRASALRETLIDLRAGRMPAPGPSPGGGPAGPGVDVHHDPAITGQSRPGMTPTPAAGRGTVSGPRPGPPQSDGSWPAQPEAPRPVDIGPALDGRGPAPDEFELLGVDRGQVGAHRSERVVSSRRGRLVPLFVVAAIAALGFGIVSYITGIAPSGVLDGVLAGTDGPVEIASVASFDPQSTDEVKDEREDLAPLAIDGDEATAWQTEQYRQRELGGGLKDGVGLQLHLSEPRSLNEIELLTASEDWAAEIYVSDSFSDDSSDWGEPVASIEAASYRVALELDGAEGGIVLLWIRDTGVTNDRFLFQLDEVVIS